MTVILLAERVDRIERQLKFWKLAAFMCLGASLFIALISFAWAKPLRIDATAVVAEEFDLANPNGRIMARLVADPADSNAPMLVFKYPNDNAAAMIGVSQLGPTVSLFATDGHTRTSLDETPSGPALSLLDNNDHLRVLVHAQNKKPAITIFGTSITEKLWVAPTSTPK